MKRFRAFLDRIKLNPLISLDIIFIISLIIFSIICMIFTKSKTLRKNYQKNLQLSNTIKTETEFFLSSIMQDLFSIAKKLGKLENWEDQPEEWLNSQLKQTADINKLTFFNYGEGKNQPALITSAHINGSLFERGLTQGKIISQNNVTISSVYPSEYIVPMIDISLPVKDFSENKIIGAIKAEVLLDRLWKRLSSIQTDLGTTFYLIDKNGKLIIHSELGRDKSFNVNMLNMSHIEKVKKFIYKRDKKNLGTQSVYYNDNNAKVIGILTPIDNINWGIVIEELQTEALASYYKLQRLVFFILAGLILFVCLSSLFFVSCLVHSKDTNTRDEASDDINLNDFAFEDTKPHDLAFQDTTLNDFAFEDTKPHDLASHDTPLKAVNTTPEKEAEQKIEINLRFKLNSDNSFTDVTDVFGCFHKQISDADINLKKACTYLENGNGEFRKSINELENVSEKLEESRRKLKIQKEFQKHLVEKVNVLIVALNKEGEILLFNKKCEEVTGYVQDDVIGNNWHELMALPEKRKKCLECFISILPQKTSPLEYQIITKEGKFKTISWRGAFLSNEESDKIYIFIGEDISEQKRLQQQWENKNRALEEKNRELQSFISIVSSNDVKAPLYVIQDLISIILRNHRSEFGEIVAYYLERIKKNAGSMDKSITNIVDFLKVQVVENDCQYYPISKIIQKAFNELSPIIKEKEVYFFISKNLPVVFCDPNKIFQVVMHLISNAINFIHPGGNGLIEIGCSQSVKKFTFFVKDNGIGIGKENFSKIFVPLKRIKESQGVVGRGLGLAMVKKIVESHDGEIWVDSQVGKGTTFYFTLPDLKYRKQDKNFITANSNKIDLQLASV